MSQFPQLPRLAPPTLNVFSQSVSIEGALPFDLSRNAFEPVVVRGRIRFLRRRRSLITEDVPGTDPHFRLPLLPLVVQELTSRREDFELVQLTQDSLSRLLVNNPAVAIGTVRTDNRFTSGRLPRSALEFMLANQNASVEFSSPTELAEFIGAAAVHFPAARIAVLTITHYSCWTLRAGIMRFSGRSSVFVAFRQLPEDFFESRDVRNVPRIVVGTPDSLANNNWFAGGWTFDLIFIVEPRLLLRDSLLNYLSGTRPGTHVITCIGPSIACDPRWQPVLYEYAGFSRGILTGGAEIFDVPRIRYDRIRWRVGGRLSLLDPVDFVNALDTENRRLQAIGNLLSQSPFNTNGNSIYLVFARKMSVEAFRRLEPGRGYRTIDDNSEIIVANDRVVLTTAQLDRIRLSGRNIVVWGGARRLIADLYRLLVPRMQPGAELQIVDIQDSPQTRNAARLAFIQTVRAWNRDRRREYESLGYLPAEGTTTQHLIEHARRLLVRDLPRGTRNV